MSVDNYNSDRGIGPQEQLLIETLPASKEELAETLGVQPDSVYSYITRVRTNLGKDSIVYDYDVGVYRYSALPEDWDVDYIEPSENVDLDDVLDDEEELDEENNERKLYDISTKEITEDLKDFFVEEDERLLEKLNQTSSTEVEQETSENGIDLLISMGDIHIGEEYEPEFDLPHERPYTTEMASRVPLKLYEKVKPLLERRQEDIDNIHLVLTGDIVDGRAIYPRQRDHQDPKATIRKQLDWATLPIFNLIQYLAQYSTVNVIGVKGNHGEIRLKQASGEDNLDLFVYDRLKLLVRSSDIGDKVNINTNSNKRNRFKFRGGKYTGFITHGKKCKLHAYGTKSSQAKWSNWQDKWDFDIAFRGHYHQYRIESVKNKFPIVMSPSPAPGALFADEIGLPDMDDRYKLGTVTVFNDEQGFVYNRLLSADKLDELNVDEVDYKINKLIEPDSLD